MKKIFSIKNKKKFSWLAVFMVIFFVSGSRFCLAGPADWIPEGIAWAFYKLAQVSGFILLIAMKFVNLMVSKDFYDAVLFSKEAKGAINLGWVVVRDFLNLFFILMLLLIAIGTILRVPSYGDKKMVFNVVLAALLINFSKPIALVFIDVSQLAMGFFMGALSFENNITFADKILDTIKVHQALLAPNEATDKSYLTPIFLSMVAIIFFLVMAVMLFVLAATLLVRVVAFWVLIILSPMAMFGLAMPRTGLGSLKNDWFQKMFHWSFFGPVQLFFLWLAVLVMVRMSSYQVMELSIGKLAFDGTVLVGTGVNLIGDIFKILVPYVSAIYLLFYGYDMSKKVSTGAALSVMSYGSRKMSQYGKKWGKMAAIGGAGALAIGGGGLLGAGAVAGAAGGYYGGRAFGRRSKETINATREKWGEEGGIKGALFKTEEQRKKAKEDAKNERVARIKGGEEEKRYWRGRASKQKKDWEDVGVEDSFLEGKMKGGNSAEKKAAAQILAEKGKINSPQKVKEALGALGGDKVLEGKLRKSLKEENVYSVLEYDKEEAWKNLGAHTKDESSIKKAVAENEAMKKIAQNARIDLNDGSALLAHFNGLKSGSADVFREQVFFGQMNGMSKAEIFKQKDFFTNTQMQQITKKYLGNNTGKTTVGGVTTGKGRGFSKNELNKEIAKMNDAKTQTEATNIINSIP